MHELISNILLSVSVTKHFRGSNCKRQQHFSFPVYPPAAVTGAMHYWRCLFTYILLFIF